MGSAGQKAGDNGKGVGSYFRHRLGTVKPVYVCLFAWNVCQQAACNETITIGIALPSISPRGFKSDATLNSFTH